MEGMLKLKVNSIKKYKSDLLLKQVYDNKNVYYLLLDNNGLVFKGAAEDMFLFLDGMKYAYMNNMNK